MSVDLKKSKVIDLKKYSKETEFLFQAGWDLPSTGKTDIDIFAIKSEPNQEEADLVFFNNLVESWAELDGDNRSGAGDFPDETIKLKLNGLADGTKIKLAVGIYEGAPNFALVENLKVNINESTSGKELAFYEPSLSNGLFKAIVLGELIYSQQNGGTFTVDNKTYDSIEEMLRDNGVDC